MRIPFDSLTLAAVTHELQGFVGARIQRITQPDPHAVVLELYGPAGVGWLLLSCDPVFYRAHLITRKPQGHRGEPPAFCMALRSRIDSAFVTRIEQVRFDRILRIDLSSANGDHVLIAELMAKHSNLILVGPDGRIVASARSVGPSKSKRPVTSGRPYAPPPFEPRVSLLEAPEPTQAAEGASPFLLKLMAATGTTTSELREIVEQGTYRPVLSPGNGAYPLPVDALDLPSFPRESIGIALEQHYATAIPRHAADQLRQSLTAQLSRVLVARDAALNGLREAQDSAKRAGEFQLRGELILAYGHQAPPGASSLSAHDYEGVPLEIKLDPEMDALANANRYFERAKKAKAGAPMVRDQIARISADREELLAMLHRVESEERLDRLEELQEQARAKKWLHEQHVAARKEDRPFEGHRIRELHGPHGWTVLYGENATSNDYLTLRVAKPNDLWLHVRAGVSAHVVIQTRNQPEKVSQEALRFAAKVAVQNSPQKHAGYVPVDYTLKKYVRKPKGAPPGTALYTHEKTLHVEG
jgi:predicted ribosome quality control (RQC) complex YloA/Tae2 family protein